MLYITSQTAQTVTLGVKINSSGAVQTGVGLGGILALRQKGYDTTPLAIRIIGKVTAADSSGQLNSSGYLEVKGKNNYSEMNITIEGIGNDAYAYGWGMLLRYVGNVEVRNLGVMLFPDDGISMDSGNMNVWVHNNDIFMELLEAMQTKPRATVPQTLKMDPTILQSLTTITGIPENLR